MSENQNEGETLHSLSTAFGHELTQNLQEHDCETPLEDCF